MKSANRKNLFIFYVYPHPEQLLLIAEASFIYKTSSYAISYCTHFLRLLPHFVPDGLPEFLQNRFGTCRKPGGQGKFH
jgi:hypothetical protein